MTRPVQAIGAESCYRVQSGWAITRRTHFGGLVHEFVPDEAHDDGEPWDEAQDGPEPTDEDYEALAEDAAYERWREEHWS